MIYFSCDLSYRSGFFLWYISRLKLGFEEKYACEGTTHTPRIQDGELDPRTPLLKGKSWSSAWQWGDPLHEDGLLVISARAGGVLDHFFSFSTESGVKRILNYELIWIKKRLDSELEYIYWTLGWSLTFVFYFHNCHYCDLIHECFISI